MPAQSPTLSPTLSAIVAALRGSSSGMPCSTLPTRSAPTSAALVKMPPPTRMNMASRAAPNAKPSSTRGASPPYASSTTEAPSRPSPTVNIPTTPPARKAVRSARFVPAVLAACATRRLVRVASVMPTKPTSAENPAPNRKNTERPVRTPVLPGSTSSSRQMTAAKTASVRNWRRRYAAAPSCTARAISIMFGVPWPSRSTSRANNPAKPRATSETTRIPTTRPWSPLVTEAVLPAATVVSADMILLA